MGHTKSQDSADSEPLKTAVEVGWMEVTVGDLIRHNGCQYKVTEVSLYDGERNIHAQTDDGDRLWLKVDDSGVRLGNTPTPIRPTH